MKEIVHGTKLSAWKLFTIYMGHASSSAFSSDISYQQAMVKCIHQPVLSNSRKGYISIFTGI